MANNPTDKEVVVAKIENGEVKVKKGRSTKAEHKGARAKIALRRTAKDSSHRQIIFSHSTALFSIPTEIRDKAKLPEMYNNGLGARVTYDENKRCIVIKLDQAP
jgi:hypothetical protein